MKTVDGVHIVFFLQSAEIGIARIPSRPASCGSHAHLVDLLAGHIPTGKVTDDELLVPQHVAPLAEHAASHVGGAFLYQLPEAADVARWIGGLQILVGSHVLAKPIRDLVAQQLQVAVLSRTEDYVARQLAHVLESPGVAASIAGQTAPLCRQLSQLCQLGIPADTSHSVGGSEGGESARSHLVAIEVYLVHNERLQLIAERD